MRRACLLNLLSAPSMISGFRVAASRLPRAVAPRRLATVLSAPEPPASTLPPVSLLAGFLGTGKTTALSHLLENREGLRVGVIVNDVASVNIDASIISRQFKLEGVDMVELQNGCVCCGPQAGQLAPAVKTLCAQAEAKGAPFNQVVIELSGVADPAAVRFNLAQGGVETARVVTLVDANAFPKLYHSWDVMEYRDDLGGGMEATEADPCVAMKKVVELLTAQIEEADLMLVNKADLATPSELSDTLAVCSALNTKSKVLQTTFGACALDQILPSADAAVKAACEKKDCTDPTHDHSHSHQHATAEEEAACTDPTHDHSHSSHNHAAGACTEPACNDPTHDHSHSHQHATAEEEAACTDPTHDHSHSSHNHAPSTNDADSLGISSFVYRAKRPFSESRLLSEVVDFWPMPRKDLFALEDYRTEAKVPTEDKDSPFETVLRSKGWVTLDRFAQKGVYWTHAGRHFGLEIAPVWKRAEQEQLEQQAKEDASAGDVSDEDVYQEVVFIGMGMDEDAITEALDSCLLTDSELEVREARRAAKRAAGLSPDVDLPPRRFTTGQAVEAFTGDGANNGWSKGTIVGINYREPEWPESEIAPYQIQLDDGTLIFAPMDEDRVVRAIE